MTSRFNDAAEAVLLPVLAIAGALLLFGLFVALAGFDPLEVWKLLFFGAFGDAFSLQNTLQRAAPLMLTALCVALPARAGLTIIGGEGALIVGALACAGLPYVWAVPEGVFGTTSLMLAAALGGAAWIALAGWLRQYRGVNETISSLLLAYVAVNVFKHLVEGPMRDPASLNKPSTFALQDGLLIGPIGSFDVHWGLVWGVVCCVLAAVWLGQTTHGFATRVVGGNVRAAAPPSAQAVMASLPAGLAGGIEIAAVHTAANASVIAGLGYTGILVSFAARHHPLAIIPVAIVLGGFGAAGCLLQRRLGLPDASVQVLLGFVFVLILSAEAARGRIRWSAFMPSPSPQPTPPKGAA
jgi:simple sugar transport system permease protein